MTDSKEHAAELPKAVRILLEARTTDAVFVVDPEYRIVHWDARAESLTGLLAEEMVGKPCYEALQGECDGANPFSAHVCSVMRLAQDGQPLSGYDMRLFTCSGGRRWVNVSNLVVDTEEGPYLVHLMRDSHKAHEVLEMAQELIWLSSCSKKSEQALERRDVPELTPRQMEVLELLAAGRLVKELGKELYLSQATIRNHVRSLLQALGAHSQLEALAKVRKIGVGVSAFLRRQH